jgi:NAD(P)-dependent dehydrogenase (short-subunit alcohol dehydrogenase family)
MPVLREKLLAGRRIAVGGMLGESVIEALRALDAVVEPLSIEQLLGDEGPAGQWARAHAPLDALVWSAAGAFATGGVAGLDAALEETWAVVREVANGALIEAPRPGKLLLIGPRSDAGALAGAARAGLENLVRTLSVEWARYGVTAVMIAPGEATNDQQLAELVCFVVSEAGEYLSGCRLELGATG